jgi:hypothetical protein
MKYFIVSMKLITKAIANSLFWQQNHNKYFFL